MNIIDKIHEYALEEIMGDRFGRYSKYVIQDRAIPDVRDGLKPVQRRILYAMYKEKNTYDKGYRKCAKTVGNVVGNFHPHGDTSVYEAMVRMSQDWKNNHKYIEIHGNNGSMDGDCPAAMRYTEARLSKIANELLKDIEKNTVLFSPNYDDTELEPTVLPAKFPNLLVNGANGISAGYATNIPPHNLCEICNAVIKKIDKPDCSLEELMEIVKGPDFPTGGIVEGLSGIKEAFLTGRGKIIVKCRANIEKNSIIITEIPYEVNKAQMVRKIDEIRIDKKIDGIVEVRDETDREGLRIAIDLKKDCNKELVLNYLYKNTDMQISYNYNMVTIENRRPKLLGLIKILDAFINHQKEVVTKRTKFDLEHAKARFHIVEGLIKALSILDEIIATIRASKNKSDAKENLKIKYDFTEIQADAIVTLQLYKLTNTDVTLLEEEMSNLTKIMNALELILSDEKNLMNVIKKELIMIKDEYGVSRKTDIVSEITEIKIDTTDLISKEDVIVVITKDGYIKKVSKKSYLASNSEDTLVKQGDYPIGIYEINTLNTILVFTDKGNYLYIPVHTIPDIKWKELGKHVSNLVDVKSDENIIYAYPVYDFSKDTEFVIATKYGMIKRTKLNEYQTTRRSKPISTIKLKENDLVVGISPATSKNVFLATKTGYGLWFDINEVPVIGIKASGVKSIKLKDDEVISMNIFDNSSDYITIFTNKNSAKRIKISDITKTKRASRGVIILKQIKSNPVYLMKTFIEDIKQHLIIKNEETIITIKISEISIMDRLSGGSIISKKNILDVNTLSLLISNSNDKEEIIKDVDPIEKEESVIMTMEDFFEDFDV